MNIKIITIHSIHNFGSVYQAFALYNYLKEKGHIVSIIDYRPKYINSGKNKIKTYLGRLLNLRSYLKQNKKYKSFISNMQLSTRVYKKVDELKSLDNKDTLFLAGGDQLWNDYHPCGNDSAFKLSFVNKGKKAAFGTSLGRNNFKQQVIKKIKREISDFMFAGVRELSSSKSLEVNHVIDPILLMDRNFYISNLIAPKINENYIVVYLVKKSQMLDSIIEYIRRTTDYKIVHVCGFIKKCDNDYFYKSTGPRELLGLINSAKMVISASFHATLFSIYLNKKFLSLLPNKNTNARIEELLSYFSLENRMVKSVNGIKKVIDKDIDFNDVNTKMNDFIESSKLYLDTELEDLDKEN